MPPKKQQPAGSSSKVKDDKTFGMKNKNKSAKVQKQIATIEKQQAQAGKSRAVLDKEKEKALREKAKFDEEKRKKEEAALFKPVQTQKVPFGVDPKTVLCAFYKAGTCEKGTKCKFSHDLNVGRKVEKKNLYEDSREDKATDTMDKWDEEKLRTVVLSKTGNPRTTTDASTLASGRKQTWLMQHRTDRLQVLHPSYRIREVRIYLHVFVFTLTQCCRYGWFWECPNGESCHYRHALPPGFVLKSQKKAIEDAAKANVITLEEFLEVERHKLGTNLTPVTPESFAKWKQTRMNKKQAEEEAIRKAKDDKHAAGKNSGMSGRDLFTYNPEWFEDEEEDEEDWDLAKYRKEQEDEAAAAEEQRIRALQLSGGVESEVGIDDADGGTEVN
ncbi:Translation machinery-associated protein 46 [Trametes pubescens]|uniref:Translation machinery-associated protein 46 n=1 Tax=Trametes pubescens TaxID=154538 RepID=A0A1M2VU14_TRAPU|nr:Translation machinery-associated protein 46 [Trametes pubescens]